MLRLNVKKIRCTVILIPNLFFSLHLKYFRYKFFVVGNYGGKIGRKSREISGNLVFVFVNKNKMKGFPRAYSDFVFLILRKWLKSIAGVMKLTTKTKTQAVLPKGKPWSAINKLVAHHGFATLLVTVQAGHAIPHTAELCCVQDWIFLFKCTVNVIADCLGREGKHQM